MRPPLRSIGTLAITPLPISKVLYLDVFGALFAVHSLLFVHIPKVATAKKTSIFKVTGDLREGLKAVLDSSGLSYLFLYAMAIAFFTMPVAIMFPLMTIEHYLGGKWEISAPSLPKDLPSDQNPPPKRAPVPKLPP